MNKRKLIFVVCMICVNMLMLCYIPVFADKDQNINPFSITATDLDADGKFTVNINISKDCVIEAYKLCLVYDSSLINISDGYNQYANYFSFLDKYNSNKKGICLNNHIAEQSKIVFTGAQPVKESAALNIGDRVAYVNFKVSADNSEKTIDELLKGIKFTVENCTDGEEDIVKKYPEEFADPMLPVGGDDLRGEDILMGDIDFNGKVDLNDATMALKAALAIIPLDEKSTFAADIDKDGEVNLPDAVVILKAALDIVKL